MPVAAGSSSFSSGRTLPSQSLSTSRGASCSSPSWCTAGGDRVTNSVSTSLVDEQALQVAAGPICVYAGAKYCCTVHDAIIHPHVGGCAPLVRSVQCIAAPFHLFGQTFHMCVCYIPLEHHMVLLCAHTMCMCAITMHACIQCKEPRAHAGLKSTSCRPGCVVYGMMAYRVFGVQLCCLQAVRGA